MLERLRNSWGLIQASFAVLRADKELILFPVVSAIGVLIVTASFAFPMLLAGLFDALIVGRSQVVGAVIAFLFYVVQYFVIIFSNAALVGAAMIRLGGGDPTVRDGFRVAMKHIPSIFGYALISATVGMILRWLSQRGKFLGRIVSSILGLAWNLATYLVVPVLVVEGVGPIEAVKRSARLLKETWGEQIVGNLSIGLIFGLVGLGIILLAVPAIFIAFSMDLAFLGVLGILALFLLLVFVGLVSSTLNGVYVAAVYRYAVTGEAGKFFSEDMVRGAFRRE